MMHLDDYELDLLERAGKKTGTDYWSKVNWFNKSQELDGWIASEDLMEIIADLMCEIGSLEEKLEDKKEIEVL